MYSTCRNFWIIDKRWEIFTMNKRERKTLTYITIVVGLLCIAMIYIGDFILN